MAPVWSAGLRSREGEGEGDADLQRVRQVLVAQASAAGRLSCAKDVLVAVYYMLSQRCQ